MSIQEEVLLKVKHMAGKHPQKTHAGSRGSGSSGAGGSSAKSPAAQFENARKALPGVLDAINRAYSSMPGNSKNPKLNSALDKLEDSFGPLFKYIKVLDDMDMGPDRPGKKVKSKPDPVQFGRDLAALQKAVLDFPKLSGPSNSFEGGLMLELGNIVDRVRSNVQNSMTEYSSEDF